MGMTPTTRVSEVPDRRQVSCRIVDKPSAVRGAVNHVQRRPIDKVGAASLAHGVHGFTYIHSI